MEYTNDMNDVCKSMEEYNPEKNLKVLIMFDNNTADMTSNKILHPIVIKLFIRGRKLNIPVSFITQSYLPISKDVRLNTTQCFIMNIPNAREIQEIAKNHSSDIGFKDFVKICR